jgi:hypothetical protein
MVQLNVRVRPDQKEQLRVIGRLPEWREAGGASGWVRDAIDEKVRREHSGLFESTEPSGDAALAPEGVGTSLAGGSVGSNGTPVEVLQREQDALRGERALDPRAAGTAPLPLAEWIQRRGIEMTKGAINYRILTGKVTVGGLEHRDLEATPQQLARGVEIDGEVV